MSDLHGQIMNIQVESKRLICCIDDVLFASKSDVESVITLAYKIGHRDARHVAAEMAISVQDQFDKLAIAIKAALCDDPDWRRMCVDALAKAEGRA